MAILTAEYRVSIHTTHERMAMKKTDWPIRWDLLLRYRLIEIIALWEGRLTTNHICHSFGIGRQQASKDINTYLRELAPDNLVYDRHLKGYVPAPGFAPVVTRGEAEEYRDLLARQESLSDTFESFNINLPGSNIAQGLQRVVRPDVMRAAVIAARHGRQLQATYVSLEGGRQDHHTLEPHTLVCVGGNWHLRAWCASSQAFADFALSRFRDHPEVSRQRNRHTAHHDDEWNRQVTLSIQPDRRLTKSQQDIIAEDYGMKNHRLEVTTRSALAPYLLASLGISEGHVHPEPLCQQLELANQEQFVRGSFKPENSVTAAGSLC